MSHVPRPLRHAIKIGWQQVDPDATAAVDPQFREPTGAVQRTYNIITGQLASGDARGAGGFDRYSERPGGDDPQAAGHITMRVVDLPDGFVPRKGDVITRLYISRPESQGGEVAVEWHVIEVRPAGHYHAGHTLYACYYEDRNSLTRVT